MATSGVTLEDPDYIEAEFNYLTDRGAAPITYLYEPPPGVAPRSGEYERRMMPVANARSLLERLSLDRQGVVLTHCATAVADFYDEKEVKRVYYPEVERLVKETTGAVRVLAFDHNVRCRPMAKRGENGARPPVKVVHNDYTLNSGPQRVRDLIPDEADTLLKNRFAVINVWRPIRGPVQESPLAVCDARSIAPADFVKHQLKYRDRTGEVYSVAFNPDHRWLYFPKMQANEAMLIKCYDSDLRRARFTAHSAFDDHTAPPDAPARESVEVRTLAFFAAESSSTIGGFGG
jgi:hypothetical protein